MCVSETARPRQKLGQVQASALGVARTLRFVNASPCKSVTMSPAPIHESDEKSISRAARAVPMRARARKNAKRDIDNVNVIEKMQLKKCILMTGTIRSRLLCPHSVIENSSTTTRCLPYST